MVAPLPGLWLLFYPAIVNIKLDCLTSHSQEGVVPTNRQAHFDGKIGLTLPSNHQLDDF